MWEQQAVPAPAPFELESPFIDAPSPAANSREAEAAYESGVAYEEEHGPFAREGAASDAERSPFTEEAGWPQPDAFGAEMEHAAPEAYDTEAYGATPAAYDAEGYDAAPASYDAEMESEEDAEHADGEDYLTMEGEALAGEATGGVDEGEFGMEGTFAEEGGFAATEAFEAEEHEGEEHEAEEWESPEVPAGAPLAYEFEGDGEMEEEAGVSMEPALEGEDIAAAGMSMDAFIPALAQVWAHRLDRSVPKMEEYLRQNLADTLLAAKTRADNAAAAARRKNRRAPRPHDPAAEARAWMVGREQDMKFQTIATKVPRVDIAPPATAPALQSSPYISESTGSPVAPFTIAFVEALRRRHTTFTASNYPGHGGGAFKGRGFSLDFTLEGPLDGRGFYPHDRAVEFMRAVDAAARDVGAEWRILYNDFGAAEQVNRELQRRRVVFMGTTRVNATGGIYNLNWHGPKPLLLHFHLDLAPRTGGAPGAAPPRPAAASSGPSSVAVPAPAAAPARPAATKPAAELTRFAQAVLNRAEGERLLTDGDLGPNTAAALVRFRQRYALGPGSAIDGATGLALVQRAIEELARQSIFAQAGVRDAVTDREITSFRLRNGLGATATVDAALRAALFAALQRGAGAPAAPSPGRPAGPAPARPRGGAPGLPTAGIGGAAGLTALAALAAPATPATVANALAITKLVAAHHGIPWRVCFTLLAHEGGVKYFRHHDGVMQTIGDARKSVIPRIPLPLARALLGLAAGDPTPPDQLAAQLHAQFPRRLAVQVATGIQELAVNLAAFHGYVALAYQAYNVGAGWSNWTVTRKQAKKRPKGLSTDEWERMCREGAALLHVPAAGVHVDHGVWQCDRNMPGWFRHYAVYDRPNGQQLIGYKYLRSFRGTYRTVGPAKATCTLATHGAAHRQPGTGSLKTEQTRAGSLDKLYDPSKLGGDYHAAVRAELTPVADDGLPLKVTAGALVKVRPDGTTLPV